MRQVTSHHDGHGLNDSITITCDERDPEAGNASHDYQAQMGDGSQVLGISFQHGPRDAEGSTPGVTDAVLLAIILDRYQGFQLGPFACTANIQVISKIRGAMEWIRHRADERAERGVLGRNEQ